MKYELGLDVRAKPHYNRERLKSIGVIVCAHTTLGVPDVGDISTGIAPQ